MWVSRIVLSTALFALAGCQRQASKPEPVRITIAGSTALTPLLAEAAKRYMHDHPGLVIDVKAGGSAVGLTKVAAGEVTLGASDVYASGAAAAALVDHPVAVVGLAAVANQSASTVIVPSLTKDQLRGVFTGKIKNWSELGGDPSPIIVVNREKGSGTRAAFAMIALGAEPLVEGEEQDGSTRVLARLREVPGSVSYLALSYHDPSLTTLSYDGVDPTPDNIMWNRYPLWAYEHVYTKGEASEEVAGFLNFLTSGRFQREVLPGLGFIPLHDMRVVRDKTG